MMLPTVAVVAGVAIWLAGALDSGPEVDLPASVDEVYLRAEEHLKSIAIYHATIEVEADLGFVAYKATMKRWISSELGAVRQEIESDVFGRAIQITTKEGRFAWQEDRVSTTPVDVWTCRGVGVGASALLGCPAPLEQSVTRLEAGRYEGVPVIVLVTSGTSRGEDENFKFTRRLYL